MSGWGEERPTDLAQRIRIDPDGTIEAFSGKIDFGQGIRTAFAQIVADELDVPIERVRVVLGDTARVPFDFGTFGSHSVAQETPHLRRAAAFARRQLLERASRKLGLPVERLDTREGSVVSDRSSIGYAELVDGSPLAGPIPDDIPLMPTERHRYSGRPMPRLEAREIVTGRATYVADVRLAGMARGAMVRPPARGAKLRSVDDSAARRMPGVIAIVRNGDVLARGAGRGPERGRSDAPRCPDRGAPRRRGDAPRADLRAAIHRERADRPERGRGRCPRGGRDRVRRNASPLRGP